MTTVSDVQSCKASIETGIEDDAFESRLDSAGKAK